MRNEGPAPDSPNRDTARVSGNPNPDTAGREQRISAAFSDLLGILREDGADSATPIPEASVPLDVELRRLANRVRDWREQGELTLQELARRSGVAASTIQKVETRQMIPTVGVLLKIARGLNRSTAELFGEPEEDVRVVHLRADARHRVDSRASMQVERLTGNLSNPALEAWRLTQQPGTGSGHKPVQWDGESLILCEKGQVRFRAGGEVYELRSGDSLHFKTAIPSVWSNEGTEPATLLFVVSLPEAIRRSLRPRLRNPGRFEATGRSRSTG